LLKIVDKIEKHEKSTSRGGPRSRTISLPLPPDTEIVPWSFDADVLRDFVIFSPENSSLRIAEAESQIVPLGIKGEGLVRYLAVLSRQRNKAEINAIRRCLSLIGWFDGLSVKTDKKSLTTPMRISDSYLSEGVRYLDQQGANEGFLYLAFYFSLFVSDITPRFFAIDNVDASLNPKLCERLMRELVSLAALHDKQCLITTHNPAILDGLNLDDDSQRLFIVSRGRDGETRIRRFLKRRVEDSGPPVRLSEAFLRGTLGALPKGF
jgi:predicted ATPase